MTSVWTVCKAGYDDQGVIAVLTTKELADEFAAKQRGSVDVIEEPLLDRVPEEVTVHVQTAHLLADGRVMPGTSWTQSSWDFCAELGTTQQVSFDSSYYLQARAPTKDDAVRLLGEKTEEAITAQAERLGRNGDWLSRALAEMSKVLITGQQPQVTPVQVCYDASFGKVHVRPGCRC